MKHLLPCTCGRTIVVDTTQAGRQVTCECGLKVDVPALRGLRALPTADAPSSTGAYKSGPAQTDWSPVRGAMFSLGVVIALLAGAAAGYCWWAVSQLQIEPPSLEAIAASDAQFDKIPIDVSYLYYLELKERGLANQLPPLYIRAKQARVWWGTRGTISTIVALIGVGLVGGSLINRRRNLSAKPTHNRQDT